MKYEYHEGEKALDNFNKGMSKLLGVPKDAVKDKTLPKRPSVRPAKG
jgi:hypothetical protein